MTLPARPVPTGGSSFPNDAAQDPTAISQAALEAL